MYSELSVFVVKALCVLSICVCTGSVKCGVIVFKAILAKGTKDSPERVVVFLCILVIF